MENLNEKWVNLLTEGKEDKLNEYLQVLFSSKAPVFAIMKYRKMQMQNGRGRDITVEDLQANKDSSKSMIDLLQEMFLEPISTDKVDVFYHQANEKGYSLDDAIERLYNMHKQDENMRFLSHVQIL